MNIKKELILNKVVYSYLDNRKSEKDTLRLFFIAEYPFKRMIEEFFCELELVFIDVNSNIISISSMLKHLNYKKDILSNLKSIDRFKFNKITSILSKEEIKILNLIDY